MNVYKFIGTEITSNSTVMANSTTTNTVNSASVVRLLNSNTTTAALVTIANSGGTISTFTINFAGTDESVLYVAKQPTDTIFSSITGLKAVSTAYWG